MKDLSFSVDKTLYHELKSHCTAKGITLKQLIIESIHDLLKTNTDYFYAAPLSKDTQTFNIAISDALQGSIKLMVAEKGITQKLLCNTALIKKINMEGYTLENITEKEAPPRTRTANVNKKTNYINAEHPLLLLDQIEEQIKSMPDNTNYTLMLMFQCLKKSFSEKYSKHNIKRNAEMSGLFQQLLALLKDL